MKIGIIEDDLKISTELAKLLNTHGYQTKIFKDFTDIPSKIKVENLDLILLDVNLPMENGYEICRKIQKLKQVPIIFVTSRVTDLDELQSIEAGGIDFIPKPYNKSILLEKIKRALKQNDPINYKYLTKKGYTLDLHLSILKFQDKEVELTRNEFRILYYFFLNADRIISKEELLEYLWNDKYYLDETILMVNMNRLRKKACEIGVQNLIETIRKKGYKL
ncbi:MAG: response regulator transcription factor [Bacilli bacterium]|nr:response regulator transcription factor [Bacilli bacterium]